MSEETQTQAATEEAIAAPAEGANQEPEAQDPFSRAMKRLGEIEAAKDDTAEDDAEKPDVEAAGATEDEDTDDADDGPDPDAQAAARYAESLVELEAERRQLQAMRAQAEREIEEAKGKGLAEASQLAKEAEALKRFKAGDYGALADMGVDYKKWAAHYLTSGQNTAANEEQLKPVFDQLKELKEQLHTYQQREQEERQIAEAAQTVPGILEDGERFEVLRSLPNWERRFVEVVRQHEIETRTPIGSVEELIALADQAERELVDMSWRTNEVARRKMEREIRLGNGAVKQETKQAPRANGDNGKSNTAPAATLSNGDAGDVGRLDGQSADPDDCIARAIAVAERSGT